MRQEVIDHYRVQYELGFYPLNNLPKKILNIINDPHLPQKDFYVPTEIVIDKPGIYAPKAGRKWKTAYAKYFHCGQCAFMEVRLGKAKSSYDRNVWLTEVYQNEGDDGHTNMVLVGYAFEEER